MASQLRSLTAFPDNSGSERSHKSLCIIHIILFMTFSNTTEREFASRSPRMEYHRETLPSLSAKNADCRQLGLSSWYTRSDFYWTKLCHHIWHPKSYLIKNSLGLWCWEVKEHGSCVWGVHILSYGRRWGSNSGRGVEKDSSSLMALCPYQWHCSFWTWASQLCKRSILHC